MKDEGYSCLFISEYRIFIIDNPEYNLTLICRWPHRIAIFSFSVHLQNINCMYPKAEAQKLR